MTFKRFATIASSVRCRRWCYGEQANGARAPHFPSAEDSVVAHRVPALRIYGARDAQMAGVRSAAVPYPSNTHGVGCKRCMQSRPPDATAPRQPAWEPSGKPSTKTGQLQCVCNGRTCSRRVCAGRNRSRCSRHRCACYRSTGNRSRPNQAAGNRRTLRSAPPRNRGTSRPTRHGRCTEHATGPAASISAQPAVVPMTLSGLTPPSSGRSKGRFAPFDPPLMSNVS
jgi:hypothetical protein